jgi:hypothetical protein
MKTLAVVIGNDKYFGDDALKNAVNDAKGMAEVFERLGYEVLPGYDCDFDGMSKIFQEFEKRLPEYDASIFYFAGHGFEIENINYLASIQCQIQHIHHPFDLMGNSLQLDELLKILKKHDNKVNIIIIDACRRNVQRGGINNSFAPVLAPQGTLIAFSTSPKMGASDQGMEGHSVYTGALLKYIGRQRLSVEELFKKVRMTVFNFTKGSQVTWEHTSLIGEFYFNTGQMIHSVTIPYDDAVVQDNSYDQSDYFGKVIKELKSGNWDRQNSVMHDVIKMNSKSLDKDQQFILGRNLLQAGAYAFGVQDFFKDLTNNLRPFQNNGENHVLNGILFEMYFDKFGQFRNGNFKTYHFDLIMALRKDPTYTKAFEFIYTALKPYHQDMPFVPEPGGKEPIIDIDVVAEARVGDDFFGNKEYYQLIQHIKFSTKDILENIRTYDLERGNHQTLIEVLAHKFDAPKEKINVNSNIKLSLIVLPRKLASDFLPDI